MRISREAVLWGDDASPGHRVEPFAGRAVNPSWEAARQLDGEVIAGAWVRAPYGALRHARDRGVSLRATYLHVPATRDLTTGTDTPSLPLPTIMARSGSPARSCDAPGPRSRAAALAERPSAAGGMMPREVGDWRVLGAFLAAVVIGGSNFVAVRYSNEELPPFWGAALRFGLASILFFLIVLARRARLPRGGAVAGVMVYGALGFGASYALLYWGLLEAPAGTAAVLISGVPLLTSFAAVAHGLERLEWRRLLGASLAIAGVAVVFVDQLGVRVPLPSLLALLLTAVAIAESTVVVKLMARTDPAATNAVGMATGAAVLLLVSLVAGERLALPVTAPASFALVYLVTIGSVGLFAAFLYVLARWTASATSYAIVLFPVVTTPLAAALRGETVGLTFGVGSALVLAGVYAGALARPGQLKALALPFARRAGGGG